MNISFFLKTKQGYQILSKTQSIDKALDILAKIKADGVILDLRTAELLLNKFQYTISSKRDFVSSRTHHGIQRVPIDEIYYFQADQKYVMVHHQQGTLLIEDTLKDLEVEFNDSFTRIHRNVLVKSNNMIALEKDDKGFYWVKLKNVETLFPVSRRQLPLVRRQLV